MLRLICINNNPIIHSNGICSNGEGLIEGEVYSANNMIFIHSNNKKQCYFILELNDLKLVHRFIPISDIDERELLQIEGVGENIL